MLDSFYYVVRSAFCFISFFDEYLQAGIIFYELFMDFDNRFSKSCDEAVLLEHSNGGVDDIVFQHLFFYCCAIATAMLSFL